MVKKLVLFMITLMWFAMAKSQGYGIDSSFGLNGVMKLKSTDSNCYISSIYEIGNNDQILAMHNTMHSTWLQHQGLIRFTSDGQKIDSTFNQIGIVQADFGAVQPNIVTNNFGKFIKALSDGSILLAGQRKVGNTFYINTLVSYLPNGSLNLNFGTNGIVILPDAGTNSIINFVHESKLSELNRLYVCTKTQPSFENKIIALHLDGSIDTNYGNSGVASWSFLNEPNLSYKNEVPLFDSSDNAFVLRGSIVFDTNTLAFNYRDALIKISSFGFVDSTFGVNGVRQLDTNIQFAASAGFGERAPLRTIDKFNNLYFVLGEKNGTRKAVIKIKPTGFPDSTCGNNGLFIIEHLPTIPSFYKQHFQSLVALHDGTILLGGFLDNLDSVGHGYDFAALKLTTNCVPDTSFFQQGYFRYELVSNFPDQIHQLIEHNNDIYLTGEADDPNGFVTNYFAVIKLKLNNTPNQISNLSNTNAVIYPNPSHGEFQISGIHPELIEVFTMTGIKIQTITRSRSINLISYSPGIYLLKIKTKDNNYYQKVIKR